MILLSDIIRLHYLDNQFLIFEFYSEHYLMAFGLYELGKKSMMTKTRTISRIQKEKIIKGKRRYKGKD